jgi:hypothetical protein
MFFLVFFSRNYKSVTVIQSKLYYILSEKLKNVKNVAEHTLTEAEFSLALMKYVKNAWTKY